MYLLCDIQVICCTNVFFISHKKLLFVDMYIHTSLNCYWNRHWKLTLIILMIDIKHVFLIESQFTPVVCPFFLSKLVVQCNLNTKHYGDKKNLRHDNSIFFFIELLWGPLSKFVLPFLLSRYLPLQSPELAKFSIWHSKTRGCRVILLWKLLSWLLRYITNELII